MTTDSENREATPEPATGTSAAGTPPPRPPAKRLTRSRTDQVLGGVSGGLGEYFGIDPVLIRIAWVALVLFAGTGILLYILAWIIIPEEEAADAQARMQARASDGGRSGGGASVGSSSR